MLSPSSILTTLPLKVGSGDFCLDLDSQPEVELSTRGALTGRVPVLDVEQDANSSAADVASTNQSLASFMMEERGT